MVAHRPYGPPYHHKINPRFPVTQVFLLLVQPSWMLGLHPRPRRSRSPANTFSTKKKLLPPSRRHRFGDRPHRTDHGLTRPPHLLECLGRPSLLNRRRRVHKQRHFLLHPPARRKLLRRSCRPKGGFPLGRSRDAAPRSASPSASSVACKFAP